MAADPGRSQRHRRDHPVYLHRFTKRSVGPHHGKRPDRYRVEEYTALPSPGGLPADLCFFTEPESTAAGAYSDAQREKTAFQTHCHRRDIDPSPDPSDDLHRRLLSRRYAVLPHCVPHTDRDDAALLPGVRGKEAPNAGVGGNCSAVRHRGSGTVSLLYAALLQAGTGLGHYLRCGLRRRNRLPGRGYDHDRLQRAVRTRPLDAVPDVLRGDHRLPCRGAVPKGSVAPQSDLPLYLRCHRHSRNIGKLKAITERINKTLLCFH